jgi:hypothetical protein
MKVSPTEYGGQLFSNHMYLEPSKVFCLDVRFQSLPSRPAQWFSEHLALQDLQIAGAYEDLSAGSQA